MCGNCFDAILQLNKWSLEKQTGWWNSANALTAILDFSSRTGKLKQIVIYSIWFKCSLYFDVYFKLICVLRFKDISIRYRYTFDKNKHKHFCNDYLDDSGWWGLAWVAAFDLTNETRYLNAAEIRC